jgi:parvulin-like peptidyl-prolyl isomerase
LTVQETGVTDLKQAFGITLIIGALAALSGCNKGGVDGSATGGPTLLTVNGENISYEQLNRHMAKKPSVRVSSQSGVVEANVAEPLDFQALQDLIGQRVIMQLAKDEGVFPSAADINTELEFRKRLNANYIKQLTATGVAFDTIKENLAIELAREKLLTKGITVTAKEADDYIKNNPTQFMDPATADMLWVFVKAKADQKRVDDEIASGQSFAPIAARFSQYPNAAEQGGKFPQRVISQMRPELQKVINETQLGRVSKWLQLSDGFAIFYIEKKTPAKPVALDADKKELVRRSIARTRGEQATDLTKKIIDKIKASQIKVNDTALAELWKRAAESLAKQGKESGSGSPATANPSTANPPTANPGTSGG